MVVMPQHQILNTVTLAIPERPTSDRPASGRPAHTASFRALAWSNLAAQSAEQIALSATPLVAVLALRAGAGATGLLAAAQTLPFLLLSLPAGLLADRTSRKLLMVTAETLRAVTLLALVVLTALGLLSVPLLAVLGFLAATGTVAFSVAAPALVPALVPREGLARATVPEAADSRRLGQRGPLAPEPASGRGSARSPGVKMPSLGVPTDDRPRTPR